MRIVTYLLLLTTLLAKSQDGQFSAGGRNSGLAGSSVTLSDPYSLFNNPGSLGRIKQTAVFSGYQNRYSLAELQTVAGGLVYPLKWATTGIGYYRFGGGLYNQQRISMAIGNKIQFVSLGAGVSMVQYHVEGLSTLRKTVFEFGGTVELIPQLVFGAHIYNLHQSRSTPTVMKSGLSYRPSENFMINVELEKNLSTQETFKAGLEYWVIKQLVFRTGFATKSFKSCFGMGLKWGAFQMDYALTASSALGSVHDMSLAYSFTK